MKKIVTFIIFIWEIREITYKLRIEVLIIIVLKVYLKRSAL